MSARIDQMERQRRRATVMAQRITTALADSRRQPPWEFRHSVKWQLRDLFGPLRDCDEHQLRMADWFLTAWLDLLPVSDGVYWSDPAPEHEAE